MLFVTANIAFLSFRVSIKRASLIPNFLALLREFTTEGLHKLLQLGQGVLHEQPELALGQLFVRLVIQQLQGSAHQVSGVEQRFPGDEKDGLPIDSN